MGAEDECVVVDNASQDDSADRVFAWASRDARIKLDRSTENLGFSRGCNRAIRASCGDYVVLLNPDAVVTPGWLTRLQKHFRGDPKLTRVGAVGPLSDHVAGHQHINFYLPRREYEGRAPDDIARTLAAYEQLRREWWWQRPIETKLLIGFCMMVPRIVLDDVGLFEERMFICTDDLDYCWRLQLKNWKMVVATDVFVQHKGQVSFNTLDTKVVDHHSERSNGILAEKLEAHYGKGRVPTPLELWGITWFRPSVDLWAPVPTEFRTRVRYDSFNAPSLATMVAAYIQAFEERDPVALRIEVEPESAVGEIASAVEQHIRDLGREAASIPNVVVEPLGASERAQDVEHEVHLGGWLCANTTCVHIDNPTADALRNAARCRG